ncbi:hypothetical protein Barb7_02828 [Bacteroidales bacterium Barb7]|nr:hypothetical protein Barb7_02828 [Bacteroidales bacterium Barb7]
MLFIFYALPLFKNASISLSVNSRLPLTFEEVKPSSLM